MKLCSQIPGETEVPGTKESVAGYVPTSESRKAQWVKNQVLFLSFAQDLRSRKKNNPPSLGTH